MAKGSNNPRGKSSDASKPYDVSNSFVKRVANRVSGLLPQQPTWLSRWMSPAALPNTGDFTNHTLSSTIPSRPPATSRADLNSVDEANHQIPAKKPRTGRYPSPINNKFLKNDLYGAEDLSPIPLRGEPVAGPSTAQPEFIASTPAVAIQQTSNKVNGDDCSETSESTSGCSSLVPQAQSTIRSLGGSRFGRMTLPTGSSMDSVHRKRPSFNTTTFASPLRASMRERLGSSPFYSGRTMYGGSAQAYLSTVHSPQRRVGPTVKPTPAQQQALPLSSTAKRILDALEQFSTPCIDAKRIPVVGSKRKLESGSQRYAELSIPSTPDLLRVKRREQLQHSTSAARQTASASSVFTAPPSPDYSIRKEDTESKKRSGKMRAKDTVTDDKAVEVKLPPVTLPPLDNLPKIDIAIPPPPLPVAATASPVRKFVFSSPSMVDSPSSMSQSVTLPVASFTFRPPSSDVSVSDKQATRTSSSEVVNGNSCKVCQAKMESEDVSCSVCQKKAATSHVASPKSELVCSCKNQKSCAICATKETCKTFDTNKNNIKPPFMNFGGFSSNQSAGTWECTTCLIRNKQEAQACAACCSAKPTPKPSLTEASPINNEKKVSATTTTSGFGDKFKKPAGSWECESCMVRNTTDTSSCVACETPKSGSKSTNEPKAEVKVDFKLPASNSGFGNMFKKASGSWNCDECLVTNDADKVKCVACETVKPGATVTDKSESSAPKFSFGIPTTTTSNSSSGTTFSFGVNKVDQPETAQKSFQIPTFTSSTPVSSQVFSFGIPKTEKDIDSSGTSTKPIFQFGSSTTPTVIPKANTGTNQTVGKVELFDNMSGNLSVIKSTEGQPAVSKPDEVAKPVKKRLASSISSTEKAIPAPLFSFGNNINTQNVSSTSSEKKSSSKPTEEAKSMFESKQETNFATSTTNTLSASSPNNIFKFGETRTVTSSGNMSISSVSTQPSYSTPKSTGVFTFVANPDKKQVNFAVTSTKENAVASNVNTSAVESKPPAFNSFAATTNSTTPFGDAMSFGVSNFGSKEPPNPFIPQTTTSLFGAPQNTNAAGFQTTNTTGFQTNNNTVGFQTTNTTSGFSNTNASVFQTNTFQAAAAPQENKPAPVFSFGSSVPKESAPTTGGFVFPVPEKQPVAKFGFTTALTNPTAPAFGFNNTTNPTPNAFGFEPKPFTPSSASFGAPSNTDIPLFGLPNPPQSVPAFGVQQACPPNTYNFGAQPTQAAQAPSNTMFEFGSNQQQSAPVAPAPSTGFVFGATPAPAPAQAQAPPAFDPNMKPTFNFTQGAATTTFSAPQSAQQGPTRKIRKAVRRTVPPVRQS